MARCLVTVPGRQQHSPLIILITSPSGFRLFCPVIQVSSAERHRAWSPRDRRLTQRRRLFHITTAWATHMPRPLCSIPSDVVPPVLHFHIFWQCRKWCALWCSGFGFVTIIVAFALLMGEGEAVLVRGMKACRWSRGITPLILILCTGGRWVVSFRHLPSYLRERGRAPTE